MNSSKSSTSRSDSPGKPTMKEVRSAMPGTAARTLSMSLRENVGAAPRFMRFSTSGTHAAAARRDICRCCRARAMVSRSLPGDAVGISVEEAEPAQALECGRVRRGGREAVFRAQIFAVAGGVLTDERDLLHAASARAVRPGPDPRSCASAGRRCRASRPGSRGGSGRRPCATGGRGGRCRPGRWPRWRPPRGGRGSPGSTRAHR